MPISCGPPPLEPQPVPATIQVYHASRLSRSPNSLTPPLGVQGRMSSYLLPLSFWMAPGGSSQPPVSTLVELLVQNSWEPLHPPQTLDTSRGVILKVRGMALFQPHLAAPPLLSPRFPSLVIPASRVGMGLQLAPSNGPVQPLYFFFHGGSGGQGPPLGFSHLGKGSFCRSVPPPLLGVLILGSQMSVEPGFSIIHRGSPHFCLRWSSWEDTTSAVSSSVHFGSPGGDPGSLQSLYIL